MQVYLSQILRSLECGGRPKGGASLDSKGIPSLGAEHLDNHGGFNLKSVKYIPEDYFNGLKNGIIEKGNILIVKDGATTGKVSFVKEDFPFIKASVNEHVFLLKIDETKAYPVFAFQYLKCPQGQRDIMRDFRGATVGGISRGFVEFVKFELPSLTDQLHIANLLSKAENLISQRKESILLLDEFLRSTFLEMFGDVKKMQKMVSEPLNNYIEFLTSGSRGWAKYYSNSGAKFLRIQNIWKGTLRTDDIQYVNAPNTQEAIRTKVKEADLLITITADLGRTAVIPKDFGEAYINQHIALIRLKKQINPVFASFYYFMPFGFSAIQRKNKSAVKAGLTFNDIKSLPIIIPPISLQTQFAQIVEKTETLKTQYHQSLRELVDLYCSLSQKAFSSKMWLKEQL